MRSDRLRRVVQILMALQTGRRYTVDDLCRLFGTSRRTVFRDIRELQAVGVSCHFDAETRSYVLSLPPRRVAMDLDREEALGLMLLTHRASSQMHLPFRRSVLSAAMKVEGGLAADVRHFCDAAIQSVSSRACGPTPTSDLETLFARIQSAILAKRVIHVRYRPGVYLPVEELDLCPLHLYYDHPTWYLFVQSREGGHREPLRLSGILQLEILDRCFVDDRRFDLVEVLGRAWSARPEGRLYHVKLRFLPPIVDQVVGVQWHSTQRVTREGDGSALVEFQVDGLGEITWWILGYGDQVQVLWPEALRERVLQAARNMIQLNSQG
jgi:predicted DNA-binding transcriptional regulator YafY